MNRSKNRLLRLFYRPFLWLLAKQLWHERWLFTFHHFTGIIFGSVLLRMWLDYPRRDIIILKLQRKICNNNWPGESPLSWDVSVHQVCGFNQKTTKGWRVLKAYTEEEDVVGWEIIVPYWNSAKPSHWQTKYTFRHIEQNRWCPGLVLAYTIEKCWRVEPHH